MSTDAILRILREGLLLVLVVSAPPMLAGMITGLIVSLLQATTQIQEQTLSYVPKLLAIFLTLAIAGPWMLSQMIRFTATILDSISQVR
ncbi:MAG: flagellar biosynthesis protein FliQ [Candidatus Solibacter sp.]|nr:flagellar biosynthesis protein FliQ [Candidatus Solibacter sp.]